ncbi:tubule protein [Wad Medani virus]|uniref:Non-structural protein NS1 n=1 Tax=Wad Medani virus TaxID=40067 RepID=A0A0H4MK89_9REOV|nr:tubule protein [Wad Medani virus]AKP24077.1 tubule protein [Wad Medani virus]
MEGFIARYCRNEDDRVNVRLMCSLSPYWRCGHRRGFCRDGLDCLATDFKNKVECTFRAVDPQRAQRLIHVAGMCATSRSEVWCQVVNAVNAAPLRDLGLALNNAHDALARALTMRNEVAADFLAQRDGVYIDDSLSLLPVFWIPTLNGQMPYVSDALRMGRYLCLFLEDDIQPNTFTFQREPEVLPITNHFLQWAPNARSRDDDGVATWICCFRYATRTLFDDAHFGPILIRHLDCASNLLRKQSTRDAERFFFQTFAEGGSGIGEMDAVLHTQLCGDPLIYHWYGGATTFTGVFLPLLLTRGLRSGLYTAQEIFPWFADRAESCQMCYIAGRTRSQRAIVADSRAQDIVGGPAVRTFRPLRHGGEDLDGISMTDLLRDECLVRQCDHWCATPARSSKDAILLAATLMHRFMRGPGIADEFTRTLFIDVLARTYLHWLPTVSECRVLFCLASLLFRGSCAEDVVTAAAWRDLGRFLRSIFEASPLTAAQSRGLHDTLTLFSVYHLQRLAQRGYTAPAPPPLPPRVRGPPLPPVRQ